jgi:quercetin dioxygenase-like cupin family protein
MKVLPSAVPEPRTDRYATRLLYDEPDVRIIAFHLLAGQSVPPHRSDSTVVVQVVEGEGVFRGEGGETRLRPGETAVYEPGEMHSMAPTGDSLRFLALIAPRPR